jgi:hypothetical protein
VGILPVLRQITRLLTVCRWNLINWNAKRIPDAREHFDIDTNPLLPLA